MRINNRSKKVSAPVTPHAFYGCVRNEKGELFRKGENGSLLFECMPLRLHCPSFVVECYKYSASAVHIERGLFVEIHRLYPELRDNPMWLPWFVHYGVS